MPPELEKGDDGEQQIQRVERQEIEEDHRSIPTGDVGDVDNTSMEHDQAPTLQERELPQHLTRQFGAPALADAGRVSSAAAPGGPRRRSPVAQCAATSHSSSRCEARYGTAACLPLRPKRSRGHAAHVGHPTSSSPRSA